MKNIQRIIYRNIHEFAQYVERKVKKSSRYFPYYSYDYIKVRCKSPDFGEDIFWGIVYNKVRTETIDYDHFTRLLLNKKRSEYDDEDMDFEYFADELYGDIKGGWRDKQNFIELCKRLPNTRD